MELVTTDDEKFCNHCRTHCEFRNGVWTFVDQEGDLETDGSGIRPTDEGDREDSTEDGHDEYGEEPVED